jgi:hypothetical protein
MLNRRFLLTDIRQTSVVAVHQRKQRSEDEGVSICFLPNGTSQDVWTVLFGAKYVLCYWM